MSSSLPDTAEMEKPIHSYAVHIFVLRRWEMVHMNSTPLCGTCFSGETSFQQVFVVNVPILSVNTTS